MEKLALIILRPFIISALHSFLSHRGQMQLPTQSKMKKYWVALDQVRINKPQRQIRISNFGSHRGKGNNIFISLSHTAGCQAVLLFRIFSERIECRSNDTSVGDVPQWRRNKNWLQAPRCMWERAQIIGVDVQKWGRGERFSLFSSFCAACPRIQAQVLSMKSHLQEKQERME